jgi:hypothetical protein
MICNCNLQYFDRLLAECDTVTLKLQIYFRYLGKYLNNGNRQYVSCFTNDTYELDLCFRYVLMHIFAPIITKVMQDAIPYMFCTLRKCTVSELVLPCKCLMFDIICEGHLSCCARY